MAPLCFIGLETITLLLALKVEYNVHLVRGNHEAADINALFGFRIECIERMGERWNMGFIALPITFYCRFYPTSDPTENDSVEGLRPNTRGPGLVTFGPDRVMEFCNNNDPQLIVRAHECTANNAGAILVWVRRLLEVVLK
ncbi:serine/threonine-protein phosphatase BSL3-like [Hibiscus syriacus]|uniref:serine/threonine-protein phosphatase BSL3-like n=1 Tax=Hibiscus syriacus TaxID=106335 RepID=UPI00192115E2|nr:serine/threonine-protein phosphatase BSL3-like [Hibiscus syriacus]